MTNEPSWLAASNTVVYTNNESYLAGLTNITVSGPASVTRTGRNVALVVSNQTPDLSGYVRTNHTGQVRIAYAFDNGDRVESDALILKNL